MESRYSFPIDLTANQTNYYWFEKGFSPEELAEIEKLVAGIDFVRAQTQAEDNGLTETEYRKSNVKWLPMTETYKWIYDKIGDLQLWPGGTYPIVAPRGKGNVVIFPSFMMHRVTPVTRGTRKSFVLWLGGGHYR